MELLLASTLTLTGVTAIAGTIAFVKVRSDAQRLFLQNLALQEELSHQNERWHSVVAGFRRHAAQQEHERVDAVQAEVDVLTIRLKKAERKIAEGDKVQADLRYRLHHAEKDGILIQRELDTLHHDYNVLESAILKLALKLEDCAVMRTKKSRGQWRRLRIDLLPRGGEHRLRLVEVKPKPKA
jgi:cell division septum initiation protein DivIVA